jgi:hypothetical protein
MSEIYPFVQEPLFHMNLMIWLSWASYPTGTKPIFRDEGFVLVAIAPTVQISLEAKLRAQKQGLSLPNKTLPDVMFKHPDKQLFVPLECKRSGFGLRTDQAKQAAILLSVLGYEIARRRGFSKPDNWQAHILFMVKDEDRDATSETLIHLREILERASIETNNAGMIGISIGQDGIYLKSFDENQPLICLQESGSDGICVLTLEDGYDPRPLQLIPLDPSIQLNDPVGQETFKERVRSAFAATVGRYVDESKFEITEKQLMTIVIEVWELWEDSNAKKPLMDIVRHYIRNILNFMRKEFGVKADLNQGVMRFTNITSDAARKIRRYLQSKEFRSGEIELWIDPDSPGFDSLNETWQ